MLVLTRRVDERIVINGEIVISVLEVGRGGQVRLGIEAPRSYQIYRQELLLEIQAENRQALAAGHAADPLQHLTLPTRPGRASTDGPTAPGR
jgi:carbon storage regulator